MVSTDPLIEQIPDPKGSTAGEHREGGKGSTLPMAEPHLIHPHAVYQLDSARRALRLTRTTVRREIRLGRLRVAKRAGKYFILGKWLLQWLEAGEIRRSDKGMEKCNS
jgi:hypothetical protein